MYTIIRTGNDWYENCESVHTLIDFNSVYGK